MKRIGQVDIIISIALAATAMVAIYQGAQIIPTFAIHRTIREASMRGWELSPELLTGDDLADVVAQKASSRRGGPPPPIAAMAAIRAGYCGSRGSNSPATGAVTGRL